MKKIITISAFALMILMALVSVACGNKSNDNAQNPDIKTVDDLIGSWKFALDNNSYDLYTLNVHNKGIIIHYSVEDNTTEMIEITWSYEAATKILTILFTIDERLIKRECTISWFGNDKFYVSEKDIETGQENTYGPFIRQ
ncbi:MAG: hypothetical protein IJU35_06230 [Paludibacteraceae bacterium]|nr:hypothetical protein [Paludibacteraceae bacterium]